MSVSCLSRPFSWGGRGHGRRALPPAQRTLANRFPAFQEVMQATAAQLASLPAQGDALTLFKNVIGPRLGLNDAAMTVGAKGLSPDMSQRAPPGRSHPIGC